jgi:hypothetical protein
MGHFSGGLAHGKGRTINEVGMYTGDFVHGKKSGTGECITMKGAYFIGEYRNDFPNGEGTEVHSNGDYYRGGFVNGVKTGMGLYKWGASGDVYAGWFENSLPNKDGVMQFKKGRKDNAIEYAGDWVDGVQSGKGVMQFKGRKDNAIEYAGDWVDGVQSGKGVMRYMNGKAEDGYWLNGKFVGKSPPKFQEETKKDERRKNYKLNFDEAASTIPQGKEKLSEIGVNKAEPANSRCNAPSYYKDENKY